MSESDGEEVGGRERKQTLFMCGDILFRMSH